MVQQIVHGEYWIWILVDEFYKILNEFKFIVCLNNKIGHGTWKTKFFQLWSSRPSKTTWRNGKRRGEKLECQDTNGIGVLEMPNFNF